MKQIVVAGAVARRPNCGGHAWVFLQYLLGFKRLGWKVLFLDRLEPATCVDAFGKRCPAERSVGVRYLGDLMEQFGLADSFSLIVGEACIGLPKAEALRRVRDSALLFNVMGYLDDEEVLGSAPRKVFLDIDPGFGQMWRELGQADIFKGHDDFVTIGENIGRPDCRIPNCGLKWITMPQPVALDLWPAAPPSAGEGGAFTSIGAWRGAFAPIEYGGRTYGLRVHEFRKFVELPVTVNRGAAQRPAPQSSPGGSGSISPPSLQPSFAGTGSEGSLGQSKIQNAKSKIGSRFDMALDIHPADARDIDLLKTNGWSLADPAAVAADTSQYQDYLRRSKAEFMVAKNLYVQANSGWFSDRSICYLASGRPVLAQDTGIKHLYPTGEGLLTFSTLEEAVAGVEEINGNYERHCRAAREIAEEYFDSDKVLKRLLENLGIGD